MPHHPIRRLPLFLLWALLLLPFSALSGSAWDEPLPPKGVAIPLSLAQDYLSEDPGLAYSHAAQALSNARAMGVGQGKAQALGLMVLAQLNLGRPEEAERLLDSLRLLIPSARSAQFGLWARHQSIVLTRTRSAGQGLEALLRSLSAAQEVRNREAQAEILRALGEHHLALGQLEESRQALQQALRMAHTLNQQPLIASTHHQLGGLEWRAGQLNQALTHYRTAMALFAQGADSVSLLVSLKNYSLVLRDQGAFDQTQAALDQALGIARQLGRKGYIADILNLAGSLQLRMGSRHQALSLYQQSLAIRTEIGYQQSQASSLENIARVQRHLNRFDEALGSLHRAIEIRARFADHLLTASTYNDLGSLYAEKNDWAQALKYHLLSLKLRQQHGSPSDIAKSLTNIGLTYRRIGSLGHAIRYFEQALALDPGRANPLAAAYLHTNMGNTLRDMGRASEALAHFAQALDIRRHLGNPSLVAQSLRSLALTHADLSQASRGHALLGQAQQIYRAANDRRGLADTHNEMGNLHQREGNTGLAIEHFARAAELYAQTNDLDRQGLCLRKIGEIQTQRQQFAQAHLNLSQALALGRQSNNAKLVELTLLAFHTLYSLQGGYQQALSYFRQHIRVRDSLEAIGRQEAIWQASIDLELNKKIEEIQRIEGEVETLRAEARVKAVELEKQALIRNYLIVVILLVVALGIGAAYGYAAIRRAHRALTGHLAVIRATNLQLEQSQRELQRTVQTKDKLFSIIGHDLRSPFTALTGLTEVLCKEAHRLSAQEVQEYSQLIHDSSRQQLALIENLLQWARSQTGRLALAPKPIALHHTVGSILKPLELHANSKRIALLNRTDPAHVLTADPDTLATALRNVISNGIKFTEPGGSITITSRADTEGISIQVADTGVGISPENLDKLFRLDVNPSTRGTRQEGGTGLGLIICKEFVQLNGGSIGVESEPGRGTTFTLRFPPAPPAQEPNNP